MRKNLQAARKAAGLTQQARGFISNGPGKLSRKELAAIALQDAGVCDTNVFEKFWGGYQELLVQKQMQEVEYFAQMLEQERNGRTCERAQQRIQQIKLSGLFIVSFAFGAFLALLFRL